MNDDRDELEEEVDEDLDDMLLAGGKKPKKLPDEDDSLDDMADEEMMDEDDMDDKDLW